MIFFIVGHSFSGKTSFGKEFAKDLQFHFIDLDPYIEQCEDMTLSEIYEKDSEEHFRALEHKHLKRFVNMNKSQNVVMCIGGGTACYENSMEFLNKNGYTIYLKADFDTILERAITNKKKRFMLKGKTDDEIKKLYIKMRKEREEVYETANLIKNS